MTLSTVDHSPGMNDRLRAFCLDSLRHANHPNVPANIRPALDRAPAGNSSDFFFIMPDDYQCGWPPPESTRPDPPPH